MNNNSTAEEMQNAQQVEAETSNTDTTAPETCENQEGVAQDAKEEAVSDAPKSETDILKEEKSALETKVEEANDRYRRIYAEYENYRKRTASEKAELILNGGKEVLKAVLPVIDDFERALNATADDDPSKEGIQLIYNKLLSTLQSKGLKEIECIGKPFDIDLQESVAQVPAPNEESKNIVIDVVQKGYYLNDKVLRFAKVVVAI